MIGQPVEDNDQFLSPERLADIGISKDTSSLARLGPGKPGRRNK
jgi:hypothetical protein